MENEAHHHADPEVSALQVTDSATGDLQAGNSGAQMPCDQEYLANFCHTSVDQRPGLRSADSGKVHILCVQTSYGDRSFAIAGPCIWNNLPDVVRDSFL